MEYTFLIPAPPDHNKLYRCHGGKRIRTARYEKYIKNVMYAVQTVQRPAGTKYGISFEYFTGRTHVGKMADIILDVLTLTDVIKNQADVAYLQLRKCDSSVLSARHRDSVRIKFITEEEGPPVEGVLTRKEGPDLGIPSTL